MSTVEPSSEASVSRRIRLGGRTLRQHAARGTLINGGFQAGLTTLSLLRGFIVAAFLTTSDFGIWGILVVGLGTLSWLANVGIADKYVQQDEDDQEAEFQRAFTLELMTSGLFMALLVVAVPVLALVYQRPEILLPGLLITLAIPGSALQAPIWILYRRMDFVRQRLLQSVEPVVGFVLTVVLAIVGAGYWSLVIGAVVGSLAGAVAALLSCPYPLRFRYDGRTLRSYFSFSWPLFVMSVGSVVIAQGTILAGNIAVGIAGVGAIALAATVSQYTERVDWIITGTLYPAICAVKDRTDLLFESFVKSNRIALMWGMPFGIGLALFASDLVTYGIGEQWRAAVGVIVGFGVSAALHQIGFNWDAYFRARSQTRPLAVVSIVTMIAFLLIAVPLLFAGGLNGFGVGMVAMTVVGLAARGYYLTQLFSGLSMVRHILRAIAPTVPAVLAVLAVRALEGAPRSLGVAIAELALYVAVTVAATWLLERDLLREATNYLRRQGAQSPAAT